MRAETCPVHHVQVLLSGQFAVRMEDGEEATFHPGDVMDIPPGHDAWVVGDEPAVLIDFAGNIEALGLPREHERIVTTLLMAGLRCAPAIVAALRDSGIEVRIGVHTGEVEPIGRDVGGVAVHATARIMALAGPSEVFASAIAVGLAEGGGLTFEARGAKQVKGLERPIELYRLM